jgi:hypothetical protein
VTTYLGQKKTASSGLPWGKGCENRVYGAESRRNFRLGVIDHGCPFASSTFVKHSSTRIWRLWDQNANARGDALDGDVAATQPPLTNFRYGAQFSTQALNRLMRSSDDVQTYGAAGMPYLWRAATHGAHVMDVFAGPIPAKARVSPNRNKIEGGAGDADAPPSWTPPKNEVASTAPIVFVQLPTAAVNDPTGRWLGHNVLDGLHYIVQCAGDNTKRVVVNLSWGPQTGPHDGSALLELAMDELVAAQKIEFERELAIVLPAGNSYQSRSHAQFDSSKGCKCLSWIVPPGNESPSFLEIWWPAGIDTTKIGITVTAPDGTVIGVNSKANGVIASQPNGGAPTWGITVVPHEKRCMALLALAPTFSLDEAVTATPGKWLIAVDVVTGSSCNVDVYVARSNPNMGGRAIGTPSYLLDENYSDKDEPRPIDPGDRLGGVVKREGTLNGIATGKAVIVAGGFVRASTTASRYTSQGSTGGRLPDYSLPADESSVMLGVLGGGVHGGSVFRLIGTSAAAPQLARYIANGVVSAMTPAATTARDARLGEGGLAVVPAAVVVPLHSHS